MVTNLHYNLTLRELKYGIIMLTREEWTRGPGSPTAVWYTDGSRTQRGAGTVVYGPSLDGRLSISLGRYVTLFQAKIYVILACVYEIQIKVTLEKYLSVCSDSQAVLKALQAANTTSPLVCPTTLWDSFVPRTFWNKRKWNCQWVHKGVFRLPVCRTRAGLRICRQNIKEK